MTLSRPPRARRPSRIVVLTGRDSGCLPVCSRASAEALRRCGTSVVRKPLKTVRRRDLRRAAGVLVPGGYTWTTDGAPAQMPVALSRGIAPPLRAMMEAGGIYVGICGGAFLGAHLPKLGMKSQVRTLHADVFGCSMPYLEGQVRLRRAASAPAEFRGALDWLERHPLYYENGPLLACAGRRAVVLARFAGALEPYRPQPPHLRAHLGTQKGAGAIVAVRVGRGCAVLVSPHPELSRAGTMILSSLWKAAREWCRRPAP